MKISAAGALRRRRPEWGAARTWSGDYLAQPAYNPSCAAYSRALLALRLPALPVFSCRIYKVNRFNKVSERGLMLSDTLLYKLDNKSFKVMKKPMPLSELGVVRVMSSSAQLVVLGVPAAKNDMVMALVPPGPGQDLVGELLGVMANRFHKLRGTDLPVEVEVGETTRCVLGGKARPLQLTSGAGASTPFSHAHNTITYHPNAACA